MNQNDLILKPEILQKMVSKVLCFFIKHNKKCKSRQNLNIDIKLRMVDTYYFVEIANLSHSMKIQTIEKVFTHIFEVPSVKSIPNVIEVAIICLKNTRENKENIYSIQLMENFHFLARICKNNDSLSNPSKQGTVIKLHYKLLKKDIKEFHCFMKENIKILGKENPNTRISVYDGNILLYSSDIEPVDYEHCKILANSILSIYKGTQNINFHNAMRDILTTEDESPFDNVLISNLLPMTTNSNS